MDEFIYIPPHEWERLNRLSSLLQLSHPEMFPLPEPSPELVSAKPATSTKVKPANKRVKSTTKAAAAVTNPSKPSSKRVAPLKRKATQQAMQSHTNTSHSRKDRNSKSKWTALGHGFWYTPGPAVATPWRQWTWRDRVGQLARCVFVCCIVYGLLRIVR